MKCECGIRKTMCTEKFMNLLIDTWRTWYMLWLDAAGEIIRNPLMKITAIPHIYEQLLLEP